MRDTIRRSKRAKRAIRAIEDQDDIPPQCSTEVAFNQYHQDCYLIAVLYLCYKIPFIYEGLNMETRRIVQREKNIPGQEECPSFSENIQKIYTKLNNRPLSRSEGGSWLGMLFAILIDNDFPFYSDYMNWTGGLSSSNISFLLHNGPLLHNEIRIVSGSYSHDPSSRLVDVLGTICESIRYFNVHSDHRRIEGGIFRFRVAQDKEDSDHVVAFTTCKKYGESIVACNWGECFQEEDFERMAERLEQRNYTTVPEIGLLMMSSKDEGRKSKKFDSNGNLLYEGEFLNFNTVHGHGTAYYDYHEKRNGLMYKGQWEDGQQHGFGIIYDYSGVVHFEGWFKEGKQVTEQEDEVKKITKEEEDDVTKDDIEMLERMLNGNGKDDDEDIKNDLIDHAFGPIVYNQR